MKMGQFARLFSLTLTTQFVLVLRQYGEQWLQFLFQGEIEGKMNCKRHTERSNMAMNSNKTFDYESFLSEEL